MDAEMETIDQKPDISTLTTFLSDAQIDSGQQQPNKPSTSSRPRIAQSAFSSSVIMQPIDRDLDVMRKEYLGAGSNIVRRPIRPIKREPVVLLERLVFSGTSTIYTVNVGGASQPLTATQTTNDQTIPRTSAESLASEPKYISILGALGEAKQLATVIAAGESSIQDVEVETISTPGYSTDRDTTDGGYENNTDGRTEMENNPIPQSPGRQHLSRSAKSKKVMWSNSDDEEEYDVSDEDSWTEEDGIQPITHMKKRNKETKCVKTRHHELRRGTRQAGGGGAVQPRQASGRFASAPTEKGSKHCENGFEHPVDLEGESEFSCEECSFATTDWVNMKLHTCDKPQRSIELQRFGCLTCGVSFLYAKVLEEHMRKFEGHKPKHQCSFCLVFYANSISLQIHIQRHHGKDKLFRCNECSFSSKHASALRRHLVRHKAARDKPCPICGKLYQTQTYLRYHIKRAHDPRGQPGHPWRKGKSYTCSTCGMKFVYHKDMKEHMNMYIGHKAKDQCTLCDKMFCEPGEFRRHKEMHKNGKPHKCKHCNYSSEKMFGLKRHVLRNHTPGYKEIRANYSCLTCAAKFEHISVLKEHNAAYEGHSPEHQCTICNRICRGPGPLKKHLETHKYGKPYKCKKCNYSTEAPSKLRKHVENMHERKPRLVSDKTHSLCKVTLQYGCATCLSKFSDFHMMKEHLEAYKYHKPKNQCNLCQKVLQCPAKLRRHMETHDKITPFRCGKKHSPHGSTQPYGCTTCSANFRHFHMMKEHLEAHTDHKPKNQCNLCQKVLQGPVQFRRHMEMHDKSTPFKCEPCGFCSEFSNSYDYHLRSAKHMATVHEAELTPDTEILCPIYSCNELFPSKIDLRLHMKTAHGAQGPQEALSSCLCNVCGKVLASISGLMEHMAVHSEERPYICSTCGTRCKTKNRLLQHQKRVHMQRYKKPRTPYLCSTCGAKFLYSPDLSEHIEANKDHVPKHQCKLCPRFFERETLLQRHIQVHLSGKPFKCDHCEFSTESTQRLRNHIASHTAVYDKPCPKCGKLFTSKKYVLRHVARVHMNVLPTFLCTLCGKILKSKTAHRMHLVTMHSDERPHECKICGKTFKARGNMEQHVKIHGPKDLRYKCEICEKGFTTREKLKTHMLCHSDDMPYQCKHCGKKFKRPNNLSSHERTHIEQWNFKCDICGQAFKWAHILRNHVKRHEANSG